MKSYTAYKNQRSGLGDVLETVKTTEKIAASSVHFLRQKVCALDTYMFNVERMLVRLSQFYKEEDHPLLREGAPKENMLIVLTGNKGLVGGLWHKIINILTESAKQYQTIVVAGTKGVSYLKEENISATEIFSDLFDVPEEEEIINATNHIFNEFKNKELSRVDILYPKFISLTEQPPVFASFLPFEFVPMVVDDTNKENAKGGKVLKKKELPDGGEVGKGFPIFEPSKRRLFGELLQKYIGLFFYKIIMETKLSELSARTVATEHAASKTGELIKKLTFDYAKERRRNATQRQLESFAAHKII